MPVAPDSRRSPSGFDDFAPAPLEPTAQMADLDTPEQPMEAPPPSTACLKVALAKAVSKNSAGLALLALHWDGRSLGVPKQASHGLRTKPPIGLSDPGPLGLLFIWHPLRRAAIGWRSIISRLT
jgi:hypothetical protein